jgi:DNA polymerase-1
MTNKNNMLLIIDGSSLLSSSFYATAKEFVMAKTEKDIEIATEKLLKTSTGIYTNGVYGFFKTFKKILQEQNPSHVAVVFDRSRETTFRKKMYHEYKSNRKPCPAPLKSQFKITQDILEYIGIPVFLSEEYEADDYAGSIVKKFENDISIYCYTKDQDYLQLISDNTKIWLVSSKSDSMFKEMNIDKSTLNIPESTFEYDMNAFKTLKGLNHPNEFIALKALLGDTSDNIPGIKGMGEKTAVPLINKFSTLENLYEFLENALDNLNKLLEEKYPLSLDSERTEKELKNIEKDTKDFFKKELGISRVPIKALLQTGRFILDNGQSIEYIARGSKLDASDKKLQGETLNLSSNFNFAINFSDAQDINSIKNGNISNIDLCGKDLAFLCEELARIKTDIEEVDYLKIDDFKVTIDKDKYNEMMNKYEMKSLLII